MAEGRFRDKVVLITGAAGGFGARAAERFAEEGARLVLSDMAEVALMDLADRLRDAGHDVFAERIDVSEEAEVAGHVTRALSRFHRLDVAINNAGIGGTLTPLTATSVDLYDRLMAVNARGVFLGMKHQIPPMKAGGGGVILNVASAAGLTGAGHLAAYAASKHAVVGLTRSAADEVARHGIRVNALCPSFATTPLYGEIADALAGRHGETRAEADARITARIPMRRLATEDEVVGAMLWLCDPANSFMTGQAIAVDGGLTAV
jgi:NAD(P)-dependent dehydrogenase (short-subunit alcohol dehydrogenase family)